MASWTDQFVGDRMAVDRAFSERVAASEFSSQEWGTIMTAVELDIEDPESPEDAQLVADTSQVDQVLPALEEMRQSMPGAGGPAGGAGGGGSTGGSSGGLFQSIKQSLGLGDGADDQRAEAAAALADEYARQFQDHLEERGKWARACEVAASADAERGFDDGSGRPADAAPDDASSGEVSSDRAPTDETDRTDETDGTDGTSGGVDDVADGSTQQ